MNTRKQSTYIEQLTYFFRTRKWRETIQSRSLSRCWSESEVTTTSTLSLHILSSIKFIIAVHFISINRNCTWSNYIIWVISEFTQSIIKGVCTEQSSFAVHINRFRNYCTDSSGYWYVISPTFRIQFFLHIHDCLVIFLVICDDYLFLWLFD